MADKNAKNPGQASGAWYVDNSCIGCSLCAGTAPTLFSMSDDGSVALVTKQPSGGGELALAAQALSDCPVEAIGSDA
ncbi:MAG: ferredoxin [Rectinemataceae bacterium]